MAFGMLYLLIHMTTEWFLRTFLQFQKPPEGVKQLYDI